MADAKEYVIALISSTTVNMLAGTAAEVLYTVPTGKVLRLTGVCIKNPTATLAGATSISITNFCQTFNVSSMTTSDTDYMFFDGNNALYTESAATVDIEITKTAGSTGAANATIDLFGYLEDA